MSKCLSTDFILVWDMMQKSNLIYIKISNTVTIWLSNSTFIHIYPREMKTYVHTKKCSQIAPKWKQPNCQSTDEWINKVWPVHAMEYYFTMKRNTIWYILQCGWDSPICSGQAASHTRKMTTLPDTIYMTLQSRQKIKQQLPGAWEKWRICWD